VKQTQLHNGTSSTKKRSASVYSVSLAMLLLVLALTVPLGSASRAQSQSRVDGPEVVMDVTKRDFGDVFAGEELEQVFLVRNAGTKPLELSQKSTLATGSTTLRFEVTEALWRPANQHLARGVAALRAAPS